MTDTTRQVIDYLGSLANAIANGDVFVESIDMSLDHPSYPGGLTRSTVTVVTLGKPSQPTAHHHGWPT